MLISFGSHGCHYDDGSVVPPTEEGCPYQLGSFDWSGLDKGYISLGEPLITIKGSSRFLDCGYINVKTCNKTGEVCAVVYGVDTHNEILSARVRAVSDKAAALGVEVAMTGSEALELLR